jgi:hypothetical protein
MVRPLALDATRMAQDVVSGQGFLEIAREDHATQGVIGDPGADLLAMRKRSRSSACSLKHE